MENNNKKNNNTLWIVIGIIVVVLIIWFAIKKHNDTVATSNQQQTTSPEAIAPTEDISAGSVDAPKTTGGAPATIAYTDALVKYQGKIIQLDSQCHVTTPNSWTFPNNTDVMIDNRSDVSRTVKVGTPVTVKAYGFKIVNVSSAKLPATWYVDCDGNQNVATILIQK